MFLRVRGIERGNATNWQRIPIAGHGAWHPVGVGCHATCLTSPCPIANFLLASCTSLPLPSPAPVARSSNPAYPALYYTSTRVHLRGIKPRAPPLSNCSDCHGTERAVGVANVRTRNYEIILLHRATSGKKPLRYSEGRKNS